MTASLSRAVRSVGFAYQVVLRDRFWRQTGPATVLPGGRTPDDIALEAIDAALREGLG